MSGQVDGENEATRRVLNERVRLGSWRLWRPPDGRGTGTYVARCGADTFFVKWDVDVPILRRLSELGVTPQIVTSGEVDGRQFVIQRWIDGSHPHRAWFGEHIGALACLIRTYHEDSLLAQLIAVCRDVGPGTPEPATEGPAYIRSRLVAKCSIAADREGRDVEHVPEALRVLDDEMSHADPAIFRTPQVRDHLDEWRARGRAFSATQAVPVHPDPNFTNVLIDANGLYLVDWDGAMVSDPLRDIGPLLWWYVPRPRWFPFFAAVHIAMTDEVIDRVHWWAAYRSLSVALWIAKHRGMGPRVHAFLRDFAAAAVGDNNPGGR